MFYSGPLIPLDRIVAFRRFMKIRVLQTSKGRYETEYSYSISLTKMGYNYSGVKLHLLGNLGLPSYPNHEPHVCFQLRHRL
jgi:hypothetical protein